ncbi:hypothetical protein [Bradyrhizobium yuanmingense]|uniref:hypothetical protein n=1 Tax=Bradyrhizobium yuanmingense TaxID=108015 RepID=UPI0023B9363E|nr:hypothetical protein [Bradyrhizobium yuanmingense]MDF0579711.1 hypothetical protein [Bradyrhizobium yuanmingense]
MAHSLSIADLFARAKGRPGAEIVLELLLTPTYAEFSRLVNKAIDLSLVTMAENPELRKDRSEDELTIELVNLLRQLTFEASHEAKVGGHCDISVRGPNSYLWLGEAKKHNKGNPWLLQGFQQLNTRYSTGIGQHNEGALIIYLYKPNALKQMEAWKEHLQNSIDQLVASACPESALAFVSTHPHDRTGLPYTVRHVPLSLYFKPKDKKKRGAKKGAKKAGKKISAKKAARKTRSAKQPKPSKKQRTKKAPTKRKKRSSR